MIYCRCQSKDWIMQDIVSYMMKINENLECMLSSTRWSFLQKPLHLSVNTQSFLTRWNRTNEFTTVREAIGLKSMASADGAKHYLLLHHSGIIKTYYWNGIADLWEIWSSCEMSIIVYARKHFSWRLPKLKQKEVPILYQIRIDSLSSSVKSIEEYNHVLVFVNNFTGYRWTNWMKTKDEMLRTAKWRHSDIAHLIAKHKLCVFSEGSEPRQNDNSCF